MGLYIDDSPVDGEGVFTDALIEEGADIFKVIELEGERHIINDIGKKVNHSRKKKNAELRPEDGNFILMAIRDIAPGEEILSDYTLESLRGAPVLPAKPDWNKEASAIPLTGPDAIMYALSNIDMDEKEKEQQEIIDAKKKSKRPAAVKVLNIIEGMRRNQIKPKDLMITQVPVVPPAFRPFSMIGDTFVAGDANELYRDLFKMKEVYEETKNVIGDDAVSDVRLDTYDAVKAVYGYGDPVEPKTRQRGISGFLKQITGSNPKFSFPQRKLFSKPQDSVSRGVITVDPNLSLDEIAIPYDMAWKMYSPFIHRRLKHLGMSDIDAVKAIRDKKEIALGALRREAKERPVLYSRSPAWHKYNVVAGKPKLIDGKTISINPLVTTGHNADFDGDTMQLHLPVSEKTVEEAHNKLMPSKMLFSIKDKDTVVPTPVQELILGLYTANKRPAKQSHTFNTEQEALDAIKKGQVSFSDEVTVKNFKEPKKQKQAV
jgi:DNA-directed RNA polymerase subunit beta'